MENNLSNYESMVFYHAYNMGIPRLMVHEELKNRGKVLAALENNISAYTFAFQIGESGDRNA